MAAAQPAPVAPAPAAAQPAPVRVAVRLDFCVSSETRGCPRVTDPVTRADPPPARPQGRHKRPAQRLPRLT